MSRLFGAIRQNGYIVRDVHAVMDHWSKTLGVGPWFFVEDVELDHFQYRGKPSDMRMAVAIANSGDIQIELIQPLNTAPSMYKDFFDAGREGFQHIAYWTKDYQALYDQALALGYKVGQEGQIGGPSGRFSYFETEAHPGTMLELSDISGPKGMFFEYVKQAAAGWDGSRPIRKVDAESLSHLLSGKPGGAL